MFSNTSEALELDEFDQFKLRAHRSQLPYRVQNSPLLSGGIPSKEVSNPKTNKTEENNDYEAELSGTDSTEVDTLLGHEDDSHLAKETSFTSGNMLNDKEKCVQQKSMRLGRSYTCKPKTRQKGTADISPNMRNRKRINSLVGGLNDLNKHRSAIENKRPNVHFEESLEVYRVRSFCVSHKGFHNKGDSFKIRSPASTKSLIRHRHNSIVTLGLANNIDEDPSNLEDLSLQLNELAILSKSNETDSANTLNGTDVPTIYRIYLTGSSGVGKTALIQQFMTSEYLGNADNIPEDGADTMVSVLLDEEESILDFIDASLQPVEDSAYLDGHVIVYSVLDRNSFRHAENRLKELKAQKNRMYDPVVIIVANKQDIVRNRQVPERDGVSLATRYSCKYIEVSAILNHRVDELLVGILRQIRLKSERGFDDGNTTCASGFENGFRCLPKGAYDILCNLFRKDENVTKSCENLLEV